ncbi:MAG: endonuclease/exonuclease/phosphatase family protein [Patescibacteria group bacterium]|jgi:endonuclease/exonuclease/phosphatase family metal-dependent hydrolase
MKLRIATFNFWGLPWPLSVNKRKRLNYLISSIKEWKIDILALQEVWLYYDIKYLRKRLPGYEVLAKFNYFNPSGLAFISRLPLTDVTYIPYQGDFFHKEFPARKGVLVSQAKLNDKNIQLVNTHVFYSSTKTQSKNQSDQLNQLIRMLDSRPTILLGDFNVDYESLKMPEGFYIVSHLQKIIEDGHNIYRQSRFNKIDSSNRLPDMIFANFPVEVKEKKIIFEPIMSDHYVLLSELEIG